MKLDSPIIYVPHRVSGVWAKSAFTFTGKVDRRRVKREIVRSFARGGEVVNPQYIEACITASLAVQSGSTIKVATTSIHDAEQAALEEQQKINRERGSVEAYIKYYIEGADPDAGETAD